MQIIHTIMRKTVMLIQLQILDFIMRFRTYMIETTRGLVNIYSQLQNNNVALLRRLFDRHAFLNLDLYKV